MNTAQTAAQRLRHWTAHEMKTQGGFAPVIYDESGLAVARRHENDSQERWDENAPLIVRAVNSHEMLCGLLSRCYDNLPGGGLKDEVEKALRDVRPDEAGRGVRH